MASQRSKTAPAFWIFGGPNGSGKSTAYDVTNPKDESRSVWIVNPDLLTANLQRSEGLALDAANLAAVQRLEAWLEATLRVHQSVGVETVMSTGKYRRLVELAKTLGYTFHLFYVMLEDPALNVERVKARVLSGGHAVPEAKIIDRYWRSLDQLPWFIDAADTADIYDNSGPGARLVGFKRDGKIVVLPDAPPNLLDALASFR